MSVITTKSSVLSILRTPNSLNRTSLNRVRFQLPSNIKQIFTEFKKGSNSREYQDLVCLIRDSEITDDDLLQLLTEAKDCISFLSCDLRLFVQALIILRWTHRSDIVIKCYQEFITDLVSAHPQHTKIVVDQLVKWFLLTEDSEWTDGQPSEFQNKQFQSVHQVLLSVVDTLPMSEKIFLESLRNHYPYVKATSCKQQSFVYNLIKIMDYKSTLRLPILQLIIDKLISLDVLAPRDEIQQAEEDTTNLMFDMEVDGEKTSNMKHPFADVLDLCMRQVMEYVDKECLKSDSKCRQLFRDILSVFDNVIIKIHASHHIQFILFYLCSYNTKLYQEFLKHLWLIITNNNQPTIIRQSAVAYLSSFLARANFVSTGCLMHYITKMSNWIHAYITRLEAESNVRVNMRNHGVFHSVCTGLFYLIAFFHKSLTDSHKKLVFLQGLNLSKIVNCKLNPLKVCVPGVTETFAAVTRHYQLAYCYTIMENNSRARAPTVGCGNITVQDTYLDMYFPFDPYVLLRTSAVIHPLYRDYTPALHDDAEGNEERENGEDVEGDEDDDFIRDQNAGSAGTCSPTKRSDFMFSSSPGFKQLNMSL